MSRAIYKHTLTHARGKQQIEVHEGAKIIKTGVQYDVPTIWTEEDTSRRKVAMKFVCFHTGDTLHSDEVGWHLATFILDDATYILHVYEDWSR